MDLGSSSSGISYPQLLFGYVYLLTELDISWWSLIDVLCTCTRQADRVQCNAMEWVLVEGVEFNANYELHY